jgi:hypothetical protein
MEQKSYLILQQLLELCLNLCGQYKPETLQLLIIILPSELIELVLKYIPMHLQVEMEKHLTKILDIFMDLLMLLHLMDQELQDFAETEMGF